MTATSPIAVSEEAGVLQGDVPNSSRPAHNRPPVRMEAAEMVTLSGISLFWRIDARFGASDAGEGGPIRWYGAGMMEENGPPKRHPVAGRGPVLF